MRSVAVAEGEDRVAAGRADWAFARWFERSHAIACALLLALSLVCFLPGFVSLHPMDRDEPRFAQASKQMLETGDFVDIRFQEEARYKKPVGIHWLQTMSVWAGQKAGVQEARRTIALYRIPSLLGALATVLLTYWAALAFGGRREAFLAAALMAGCVILTVEARLATTDAMLAACSVAVMGALARAYLARGAARLPTSTINMLWGGIAVGILIKGPLVVLFAGLCALVLSFRDRSARWLGVTRPALGLVMIAVVVGPWFGAIGLKAGSAFYSGAVGREFLGKVGAPEQNHWGFPGYHLLAFFAAFWPGSAFAALAAPYIWRARADDVFAFVLAWVLPSWLVFELVSTKLPHYLLPLYPAIAIGAVVALSRGAAPLYRWAGPAAALLLALFPLTVAVGLGYASWRLDGVVPLAGITVIFGAFGVATMAAILFKRRDYTRAMLTAVGSAALMFVGALGLVQPRLEGVKMSTRLADAVSSLRCSTPQLGTLGYREPSLVFLAPTQLSMFDNEKDAATFLLESNCGMIFVDSRHEPSFVAETARRGAQPIVTTRVAGFNINGGRRVDIAAYVIR